MDNLKQSVAATVALSSPNSAARTRWAFINEWNVEPQSNDRAPMFGAVAPSAASPAARRAAARRRHQVTFKGWSTERHD